MHSKQSEDPIKGAEKSGMYAEGEETARTGVGSGFYCTFPLDLLDDGGVRVRLALPNKMVPIGCAIGTTTVSRGTCYPQVYPQLGITCG